MHSVKLTNPEALFDSAYTPLFYLYVDGVLTAPSAATLTLYWPTGDEKITDAACSISGTTKAITYSISTAYRDSDVAENYRILLKYIVAGVSYQVNFLFDDCLTPLTCSVVDADLIKLHPELASDRWDSQTTFSIQIEQAFNDIKRMLKQKGRRARMMIDAQQISDLIVARSMELICFDFAKDSTDIWWNKYLEYHKRFESDFENLHLQYDSDEGGDVDTEAFFGSMELTR